jgi:hypothetical protein
MALSRKKKFLFIGLALALGLAIVFGTGTLNRLLEESLDRYVRQKMEVARSGAEPAYAFSYDGIDIDIFAERITFTNFRMTPREAHREAFLKGETHENALKELSLSKVTVQGVGLMNFLWDKHIDISEIRVDSVTLNLWAAKRHKEADTAQRKPARVTLEGIRLPGIEELSLGRFVLGHFALREIEAASADTLLHLTSMGGHLEGLGIAKASAADDALFEPELENLVLTLNTETLDLPQNLYRMGFEQLKYTFASRDLEISRLSLGPLGGLKSFREQNRLSYEIYNARLKSLVLTGFDMDAFLNQGMLSVQHMALDSLHLEIFRDKTKPFDTGKRVLLPQQALESMDFPLHLGSIGVRNSYMIYGEQTDWSAPPLLVDFSDLSLNVRHLTTLPDSLKGPTPLEIDLTAKLDQAIPVEVHLELPYHTNTFRVRGQTDGTSSFQSLNKTVLPAVGLQFTSGRLDGLQFAMTGTPWSLRGELTLLYRNLEVAVPKDGKGNDKTLSWAANTLLKDANPNRHGHTVVGLIEAERIPYKGLGNFIWKGVQSGLVNSLNPVGKRRVVRGK